MMSLGSAVYQEAVLEEAKMSEATFLCIVLCTVPAKVSVSYCIKNVLKEHFF